MKYVSLILLSSILFLLPPLFSQGEEKDTLVSLLKKEGEEPFKSKSEFNFPADIQEQLKDYRKKWVRLTNYEFSGLHWKQFIVIYINKEPINYVKNYIEFGRRYLDDDEEEDEEDTQGEFIKYPVGTIFLKEHYLSNKGKPDLAISTTLMIKKEPGYDPKNGDWEYLQFTKDGIPTIRGKADNPAVKINCSDCHKNMAERDYVFATHSILELKEEKKK